MENEDRSIERLAETRFMETVPLEEIIQLIEQEKSLTSRLLAIVNGNAIGLKLQIRCVEEAVLQIGLIEVKNFVKSWFGSRKNGNGNGKAT
jgi:HD-like signal output (HDOD) protein